MEALEVFRMSHMLCGCARHSRAYKSLGADVSADAIDDIDWDQLKFLGLMFDTFFFVYG